MDDSKRPLFDYERDFYSQYDERKPYTLGARTSHSIRTDPKHLLFTLSRYKFCAKMFDGKSNVLEVGCGDAIGAPIILQTVRSLHGVDIEPIVIEQNMRLNEYGSRLRFSCLNFIHEHPGDKYDAVFSMDVIEHIEPALEEKFLLNIFNSMDEDAPLLIGTPNITANAYASEISKAGHINLKSAESLKFSLKKFFRNVFMFSMNDEVVHTGYAPMAHYLIALCVGKQPGFEHKP